LTGGENECALIQLSQNDIPRPENKRECTERRGFFPGGRRNDAETAARVIAAAVSRSVLKRAFTVNQSGVPQLFAACSAAPQD